MRFCTFLLNINQSLRRGHFPASAFQVDDGVQLWRGENASGQDRDNRRETQKLRVSPAN